MVYIDPFRRVSPRLFPAPVKTQILSSVNVQTVWSEPRKFCEIVQWIACVFSASLSS